MLKHKIKKNYKKFIIVGLVLITICAGIFYFYHKRSSTNEQTKQSPGQGETINLKPPTEEEKQQAEDNKQRIIDEESKKNQQQPTTTNKATVKPSVTYAEQNAGNIEIGSIVPSIFENDGTCTAKLTRGTQIITRQTKSVAEGRSTYCPLMRIPVGEFSEKGSWSLTITYESAVYGGVSAESKVEVK